MATLSGRLVHATAADVPRIIAEACAGAIGAERASVALYDPQQGVLTVEAAYGYSVALVKHLRLRPGAGIIGGVYGSGRPLMSTSGGFELKRPRNRYRTRSLISVPLVGYEGTLGVVSVCDPIGRPSFDRRDLRAVTKLAEIGSLALGRCVAQQDAEAHSRRAAVDPLTGLFNRRHFQMRLDEEIERSRRQSSPLALLMMDVDGLKQVNDQLGHPVGDHVLRTVADVLRRSVRLFDVCTRYGGDEFAILMPGAETESSHQVADRIREGVEDSPIVDGDVPRTSDHHRQHRHRHRRRHERRGTDRARRRCALHGEAPGPQPRRARAEESRPAPGNPDYCRRARSLPSSTPLNTRHAIGVSRGAPFAQGKIGTRRRATFPGETTFGERMTRERRLLSRN